MGRNNVRVHNFFVATLENVVTGEKKTYRAENIVLDCYFRYIIYYLSTARSIDSIAVGTGSGTLDPTRTALFQQIANHNGVTETECVMTSEHSLKRVLTTVFIETEANGTLTEVGIGRWGGIVTHAFFTDSEQQPISIVKTNTDRLTIEATYYVEWDVDPSVCSMYYPAWGTGNRPDFVATTRQDEGKQAGVVLTNREVIANWTDLISGRRPSLSSKASGSGSSNININLLSDPIPGASYPFSIVAALYYDLSTGLVRLLQSGQINSDTANLDQTYQIRSLVWGQYFAIQFPNHTIYPPKQLTFTITSDGSTDYNLGIPELMTSNVEVTVDGVVQDPSTYTFNGKDFTFKQAWVNSDNRYIKHTDCYFTNYGGSSSRPLPITISASDTSFDWVDSEGGNPKFVYDFGTARAVDTFKSLYPGELEYSNDGETWTNAATISTSADPATVVTFPEISARYWRCSFAVRGPRYWPTGQNWFAFVSNFDKVTPQLKFNTAPTAGSVIQVKAYTEYPVKNSNWIINQTNFDITITRGSSS